jgi:DNA primase
MKPDPVSHVALMEAELILICLDYDDAGARASWNFWLKTYGGKIKRWPVPVGKDPSAAHQEGLDIAAWIQAGIDR